MAVTATQTALHLKAVDAAARQRGQARADRLLSCCEQARSVLLDQHGARRVWLFGSLAAGETTSESDVDLAVEGLAAGAYFEALTDLMALFHGPVDLVRLEDASESLRERILAEGRAL